jgi:hypothetical protein
VTQDFLGFIPIHYAVLFGTAEHVKMLVNLMNAKDIEVPVKAAKQHNMLNRYGVKDLSGFNTLHMCVVRSELLVEVWVNIYRTHQSGFRFVEQTEDLIGEGGCFSW